MSRLILIILIAVVAVSGCKKETAKPAAQKTEKAQKSEAVKKEAASPQVEPPKVESETYTYESRGRRDPFFSIITAAKQQAEKKKKGVSPVENYDVSDFRLIAIAWDNNQYYSLISLPDGKSYTIKQGMTLGLHGGKVHQITMDSVVIREYVKDYKGELKSKDTILKLRKEEEE